MARVSFPDAIQLGFQRYFDFRGRSTRAEYWWWALFTILITVILYAADVLIGTWSVDMDAGLFSTIFELVILIPSIAVGVRRLHDINRTGWWTLLWLVPVVGWIVVIIWAIKPGDEGENSHGLPPGAQVHPEGSPF
mgnify:CR=1 FL=1